MTCLFSDVIDFLCQKMEKWMLDEPTSGSQQQQHDVHKPITTTPHNQGYFATTVSSDSGLSSNGESSRMSLEGSHSEESSSGPRHTMDSPYSPSQLILSDFSSGEDSRDSMYGTGFAPDEKKALDYLRDKGREENLKKLTRIPLMDKTNDLTPKRRPGDSQQSRPVRKLLLSPATTMTSTKPLKQECYEDLTEITEGTLQYTSENTTETAPLTAVRTPSNGSHTTPLASSGETSMAVVKSSSARLFWGMESIKNSEQVRPLRRTMSGFDGLPTNRKRSSTSSTSEPSSERKRSRAIYIGDSTTVRTNCSSRLDFSSSTTYDDDVFLDSSVISAPSPTSSDERFLSPSESMLSHMSHTSTTSTRLEMGVFTTAMSSAVGGSRMYRAYSTGVLEKGEYSRHADEDNQLLPIIQEVVYSLPSVPKPQKPSQAYRSIDGNTIRKQFDELGEEGFRKKFFLVDCRYVYEYEGGHVKTAVNIFEQDRIPDVFFPSDPEEFARISSKIPIFYCEYSQKRGPGMADALRKADRIRNVYPNVHYNEMYILDRGYKKFFIDDQHSDLCEPMNYVPMEAPAHHKILRTMRYHHRSKSSSTLSKGMRPTGERGMGRSQVCRSLVNLDQEVVVSSSSSSSSVTFASPLPVRSRTSTRQVAQRLNFDSDDSFGPV